jgi:5-formyltetrahydrofolate cyclo-ligase
VTHFNDPETHPRMLDLEDRKSLRAALIARRMGLDPVTREAAEQQIIQRLDAWLAEHGAGARTLGLTLPYRAEVDLRPWYAALHERGYQLALAVADEPQQPLQYAQWAPGDAMEHDRFGIEVPLRRLWCEPDVLVVPCVGFTADCYRLGYGGGYFDRTLDLLAATRVQRPPVIGVAFGCQRCEPDEFTPAAHDLPLDAIATEDHLFVRETT